MELLLKSSQNLRLLIEAVKIHEENMANWLKTMDSSIESKSIVDTDVSMNHSNHATSFVECNYNSIFNPEHNSCLLSRMMFKRDEPVILVKECKHIFNREHFLHWIKFHNHCPRCNILLRV